MSVPDIEGVVRGWTEIWESKGKEEDQVEYVQIFEVRPYFFPWMSVTRGIDLFHFVLCYGTLEPRIDDG